MANLTQVAIKVLSDAICSAWYGKNKTPRPLRTHCRTENGIPSWALTYSNAAIELLGNVPLAVEP
jgi:hypothetical protein